MTLPGLFRRGWGQFGGIRVSPNRVSRLSRIARETSTASEMFRVARSAGIGIRDSAMAAIRREQLEITSKVRGLSALRNDFRPGPRSITQVSIVRAKRFEYRTATRVFSTETGEITKYTRFYSSDPLTGGEIKARAGEIIRSGEARVYEHAGTVVTSVTEGIEL